MMTPVSPNPPGPSIQDQKQLLFISPNNDHHSTSLSCHTLFDIVDQKQTRGLRRDHQEEDKLVFHGETSINHPICNSSFVSPQSVVMADPSNNACGHNLSFCKIEEEEEISNSSYGSAKWMSSNMRLTRNMISPSNTLGATEKTFNTTTPTFHSRGHGKTQRSPSTYNSNNTNRVCADCNTSSTPLWRSGPKGPKSLCNACGIRQRKARKAMAEAANGFATSVDTSSTKTRVHNKEKKSRPKHFAQFKNKCRPGTIATAGTSSKGKRKLNFKDFAISLKSNSAFQQVFPRDEVAEAALLLMALSCGLVHF